MSSSRRPDNDRQPVDKRDQEKTPNYSERDDGHKTFHDVTNTRPAPSNPHRETEPKKDRDR